MTEEEAAKILEYPVYKWALDWDDREDGLDYSEAIQMAIFALRTQKTKLDRSRWEGCNWCNEYGLVAAAFDGWRYCNRCGRPLTEEAWAEMERRINDGTTD